MVWQWGDSGIVGRVAIHVFCVEASETAKDEEKFSVAYNCSSRVRQVAGNP